LHYSRGVSTSYYVIFNRIPVFELTISPHITSFHHGVTRIG